jgi:hypothetical protein
LPLIDEADLMQRMMTLLTAAGPGDVPAETSPDTESLLAPPMQELNALPRSFAQVYGTGGRMLTQLSLDAMAEGATDLATLLRALEQALQDGSLDLAPALAPAPRLSRYVYPVV